MNGRNINVTLGPAKPTPDFLRSASLLFGAFIAMAIATSCGASKAASANDPSPNQPAVTIAAIPSAMTQGSSSTLTVTASNATQVVISNNTNSTTFTLSATGGTQKVTPTATTTYTATATGASGTATAQTTITVTAPTGPPPTVTIQANPASITQGSSSTLTVAATNATQVAISDNSDSNTFTLPVAGGTQSVTPAATTIYTVTAAGPGGTKTAQATVTVVPPGTLNSINHIIIMMQENRGFDEYFGHLDEYRTARGLPANVDDLSNAGNVSLPSWNNSGNIPSYHMGTQCIGDLTPSWQESHDDINLHSPNEG